MKIKDKVRFEKNFRKSTGCWNWTGAVDSGGYGMFRLERKSVRVHRFMWIIRNGIPKKGLYVCHSCDNRRCINPKHLWLGTCKENIQDMWRKGRGRGGISIGIKNGKYTKPECTPRGEKNGLAKLTKEDVLAIRKVYKVGYISMSDLAKRFNVDTSNIGYILQRKTWTHV